MKLYIYQDHLYGGLFTNERDLSFDELYCEECGDCDWFLGEASNRQEAWGVLEELTDTDGQGGLHLEYVKKFIRENW